MDEFAVAGGDPAASREGDVLLDVIGSIDHTTAPELRGQLRSAIGASANPRLRLDLSRCTGVNIDGMLMLSVAQQAARSRGGELVLVNVPLPIARQLQQHNFNELLHDTPPAER